MKNKKRIGTAPIILGVAALLFGTMQSSFAQGIPQGWAKLCRKNNKGESVCNTLNNVLSETGQPLTTINALQYNEKGKPARLQITVPTGRLVQEGVRIQVDNQPSKKMDYLFCIGLSCMAEGELDTNLLNAMKKGTKLTITSVNFEGDSNPIDVSLEGFEKAYTGPEMRPAEIEAQRKKLFESVQAKENALDSKIKAAQEKAK